MAMELPQRAEMLAAYGQFLMAVDTLRAWLLFCCQHGEVVDELLHFAFTAPG
jgi:hypothetical protein